MEERKAPAPDFTRSPSAARALALLGSLAAFLLAAGSASAADQTVTANANTTFTPQTVTINPGDTVTWNNVGGGSHNVTFPDGFAMPMSPSTSAWSVNRTFTALGDFGYVCGNQNHQSMTGTVRVVAATPTPPPPPGGGGGGGGTPPPPGGTPPPGGGDPTPGTPGGDDKTRIKLTLKLSDATPRRGGLVRFFGSVKPAIEGRVLIQRRIRNRVYRTVTRATLKDGSNASTFSKRLRASAGVYRARILATDAHEAANSSTKRVRLG